MRTIFVIICCKILTRNNDSNYQNHVKPSSNGTNENDSVIRRFFPRNQIPSSLLMPWDTCVRSLDVRMKTLWLCNNFDKHASERITDHWKKVD